jgi:hypothetical protein
MNTIILIHRIAKYNMGKSFPQPVDATAGRKNVTCEAWTTLSPSPASSPLAASLLR